MSEILFAYEKVDATTWAYLSSLLMVGLFFKFNRFWSVRNADLLLLMMLAPGLLLVHHGGQMVYEEEIAAHAAGSIAADPATAESIDVNSLHAVTPGRTMDLPAPTMSRGESIQWLGYALLLGAGLLLLLRLLIDPTMVRRPLLEPNLTTGGLTFIGCSLFLFLMANVISSPSSKPIAKDSDESASQATDAQALENDGQGPPSGADAEMKEAMAAVGIIAPEKPLVQQHGPGYILLDALPQIVTMPSKSQQQSAGAPLQATTKIMAILSHLFVVLGLVAVGYRHFGNLRTGIAGATLYLMLPYTAIMTGLVEHAAPAALLTWAIVFYRRPLTAGVCLGLAGGMIYYPLFVLPLWVSFYWQRGMGRFISGLACALAVMVVALATVHFAGIELSSISPNASFWEKLSMMFGIYPPRMSGLEGVWVDNGPLDPIYRTPIIFSFVALSITFAIWPAQKNLGTLLSCTTAIMVAAQCWHASGGGVFVGWYLPLMLMTFLRPNLEDRVALSVLSEGWFPRRSTLDSTMAA